MAEIVVVVSVRTLHVTNIEVNGGFRHLIEVRSKNGGLSTMVFGEVEGVMTKNNF